jgi:hypothetical protein
MNEIEKQNLFPSQAKEERVFLLIRKHWFNYVPFAFFGLLMILPVVAGFSIFSYFSIPLSGINGDIWLAVLSAYTLTVLAIQLYGFVSYYLDVYIVTDRRIVDIDQNGFFKREIAELHLHQVQDVSANVTGIFGTLLHFGDVSIQTAGERENFIFRSIPHPYEVAKQIINLHEKHLEQTSKEAGNVAPAEYVQKDASTLNNSYERKGDINIEEIESQAKDILTQVPFSDRLKNPGLYRKEGDTVVSYSKDLEEDKELQNTAENGKELEADTSIPSAKSTDFGIDGTQNEIDQENNPVSPRPDDENKSSDRGEMKEGKEIDLE